MRLLIHSIFWIIQPFLTPGEHVALHKLLLITCSLLRVAPPAPLQILNDYLPSVMDPGLSSVVGGITCV